jgi:hypothetical protein
MIAPDARRDRDAVRGNQHDREPACEVRAQVSASVALK